MEPDRLYGVFYGIVTQNKDPDGLHRVAVRLPWIDRGELDETRWAQLITPMTGEAFGWYALPDIDDVVALTFLAGDVDHPVVLGGIWSKPDQSPEPNQDGKNNFRGFRSRTGHRLIFDDSSQQKVVIADKTARNVLGIGAFGADGEGPNTCAVYRPPMSGDAGVSISSVEGNLEITCPNGTLAITAGESIKINAKTTIDFNAGELELHGNSVKLTSAGPSNYDAPTLEIDGAASGPTDLAPRRSARSSSAASGSAAATSSGAASVAGAAAAPSAGSVFAAASKSASPLPPPQLDPPPAVFSPRWERPTGRFSSPIKLIASCANAGGQTATFTVYDADYPGPSTLATLQATCGADSVEAPWTTPDGPEPQELVFDVAVAGNTARSGPHAMLVTAEGKLVIDDKPAAAVELVLTLSTGERRTTKTDASGAWKVEEVPAGDYTIQLEIEEGSLT